MLHYIFRVSSILIWLHGQHPRECTCLSMDMFACDLYQINKFFFILFKETVNYQILNCTCMLNCTGQFIHLQYITMLYILISLPINYFLMYNFQVYESRLHLNSHIYECTIIDKGKWWLVFTHISQTLTSSIYMCMINFIGKSNQLTVHSRLI